MITKLYKVSNKIKQFLNLEVFQPKHLSTIQSKIMYFYIFLGQNFLNLGPWFSYEFIELFNIFI